MRGCTLSVSVHGSYIGADSLSISIGIISKPKFQTDVSWKTQILLSFTDIF